MKNRDTITTTLRLTEERNAYLKQRANEIGVSQNALILMLLDIGIKHYDRLDLSNSRRPCGCSGNPGLIG